MPRSFCEVSTEQSYLSEGHVCCVAGSKDHTASFHSECLWTESPWVEGMVWGTSQGAELDPAPAACCPSGGWLRSSMVSGVPSHHFEEATGVKTKKSSLKANSKRILLCFTSHSELLVDLPCNAAHPCWTPQNEQTSDLPNLPPPRILGYSDLLKVMQRSLIVKYLLRLRGLQCLFWWQSKTRRSLTGFIRCSFLPALCLSYDPCHQSHVALHLWDSNSQVWMLSVCLYNGKREVSKIDPGPKIFMKWHLAMFFQNPLKVVRTGLNFNLDIR